MGIFNTLTCVHRSSSEVAEVKSGHEPAKVVRVKSRLSHFPPRNTSVADELSILAPRPEHHITTDDKISV
jgi:hypothetical protein